MYEIIAVLAGFAALYSVFAGAIERSWVSGPIIFTLFGLLVGPMGLGLLDMDIGGEEIRTLAELTLALVLFADAAGANLGVLKHARRLPLRLLAIGLPLTIVLGWGLGLAVLPDLSMLEVALLATILAPTDAALGKAVVSNESVPQPVRQGLNVESGLNDGICVPVLFLFLALIAGETEESPLQVGLHLFLEEVGIGAACGIGVTLIAVAALKFAHARDAISETSKSVIVLTIALTCFGLAQALGGSGFIASFLGGLLFGAMLSSRKEPLLESAEGFGDLLSLLTWVLFGGVVVGHAVADFHPGAVVYAILSLTVIRMLPVFLTTLGLGFSTEAKLFLGWFGPRGLASIVFVVIVIDADLPHSRLIALTTVSAVALSILGHGVTANPWARGFGRREESRQAADAG